SSPVGSKRRVRHPNESHPSTTLENGCYRCCAGLHIGRRPIDSSDGTDTPFPARRLALPQRSAIAPTSWMRYTVLMRYTVAPRPADDQCPRVGLTYCWAPVAAPQSVTAFAIAARSCRLRDQNSSHATQCPSIGWSRWSSLSSAARENPR